MTGRTGFAAMALCALAVSGADVSFDAANGFGSVRAERACKAKIADGILRVDITGADSHLGFQPQTIDPTCIDSLEYRYRAKGTGSLGGQLYWWNAGCDASDFRRWNLPPPIADGEWHVVTLGLSSISSRPAWFNGGNVAGFRLDPTDAPGGTIEYEYIRLKGKPAAVTAEGPAPEWQGKLDAPVWPDLEPCYYDHTKDPACQVKGTYFKGRFVSAAANAAGKGGTRFMLRRKFTLDKKPVDAWLQGIGDEVATFSINGRTVMRSQFNYGNLRYCVASMENVLPALKTGENVLGIKYEVNEKFEYGVVRAFPGGALAELYVEFADGSYMKIDTDDTFESSVDGTNWTKVVVSDPPPAPPRVARLKYRDFANPQRLISGGPETDRVKAGETVMLRYEFKGNAPDGDFTVRLAMRSGGTDWWAEELSLGRSNVVHLTDGRWRLDIPFSVPKYIRAGEYELSLESNSICCRSGGRMGGKLVVVSAGVSDRFDKPVRVEMKPLAGRPTIHVDGKPFPLLWGGVSRGKRPDGLPRHSDMPLTAVTTHNVYLQWHPRLGVYDFAPFDRTAEQYRRLYPDAYFIWDLSVYPPPDFAERYPEEMSMDEKGERYSIGRTSWSYASRRGLDEIKEMVTQAIRYLESSPYANRIIGYRVNSGVTIEWLGWKAKPGRTKDFAAVNKAAFAKYAAERYPWLKNPHVPTFDETAELDAPDDILWNPARHQNAIAYMKYNSWIIAQDLLEACGCAKDVLKSLGREKLVGTYYGYTHYLNANGVSVWRGHFALKDLLDENNGRVDFLMSPESYSQRTIGDTCGDMKPFATMMGAGILPIIENDMRTHNRIWPRWFGFHQSITPAQTEALLRRDMAITLCQNGVAYHYSLASGVDLDSPECSAVGRDILATQRICLEKGVGRNAEIALVASEDTICAMPSLAKMGGYAKTGRWTQDYTLDGTVVRRPETVSLLNGEIFSSIQTKFARSGAPADYLLAEDLKTRPGNYKLYVFLNLFTYDEATRQAIAKLRERGATMLWLYAPGWLKGNSLADMKALTGMEFAKMPGSTTIGVTLKADGRYMGMPETKVAQAFYPVKPDEVLGTYADGKPGLAMSKVGNSLTVFSGTWQMDVPFIRQLVARAGAHVWCDSDDPIEANDALFTLHARFPGIKTVHLPCKATVVDVFAKRIVARDTDTFTFSATLHSTYLFYFGSDAESLLKKLDPKSFCCSH